MLVRDVLIAFVLAALIPGREARAQATTRPAPDGSRAAGQQSPTTKKSTYRTPVQADVLRQLIREREERKPIQPIAQPLRAGTGGPTTRAADGAGTLLPEGTTLIERQGRLIRDGTTPYFEFDAASEGGEKLRLEVNRGALLEQMETHAAGSASTFIITAEVFTYRGKNYIGLRKVSLRVDNGNLRP